MATNDSPQDLVTAAQEGDRDAFARLVDRYRGRLEALVFSLAPAPVRRKAPLEDLVQETLVRGLGSIERFEWKGDDSFLRWLGGIARRVIAGVAEKNRVHPELELDLDLAGQSVSPSRHLRRRERLERLEQALSRLTPHQQEVVRLARLEGLKIKDIAAKTGREPGAVKQLLFRGLRSLRRNFGDTESLHLPDVVSGETGTDKRDHGNEA